MSQFIHPTTGKVGVDRRGTVPENSLENKIAFAIGKLTTELEAIKNLYKSDYKALDQRYLDLRDALKNSLGDFKDDMEGALEKLETDLKEYKSQEYKQILGAVKSVKVEVGCLDDRVEAVEKSPIEQAKKILGFQSNLFWKILVPVATSALTLFVVSLLSQ